MAGPKKQSFAKPKDAKGTFARIFTYLRPYRLQIALAIVGMLIGTGANIAGTYMLKPIIDDYILPLVGKSNPDFTGLVKLLMTLGAIYVIGVLGNYACNRLMINVSTGTLLKLRLEMFTKMQTLPISYFDRNTHGEIMSRYTNDTDVMREMISQGLTSFVNSAFRIVGVLTMMIVLSPLLTGIAILMLGVMTLLTRLITKQSGKYFKARQDSVGKVNGYIEEMIEGQKVVKVFCHEDEVNSRFGELNETLRHYTTQSSTFASIMGPIMNNLSHVNYAIVAAAGGLLGAAGAMDIGTLGSFLLYTRNFSMPISELAQQANNVMSALAGAERIFAMLDEKSELDEGKVCMVYAKRDGKGELVESDSRTGIWAWKKPDSTLVQVKGDVRFNGVTFSYDGQVDALKNISIYAKPGQKIAFVGSTGAGKTTITNLINRFYDIQQGEITYDGIPITQIEKASLRSSLGIVLQDTHLFTGTVKENIRYGKLDATDDDIIKAAKLANAHYFISHLPQGYDTMLTADGANLSQGQRQLISIARAAVADPPVLILDEATSSIDTRTEALIEKGMDSIMKDRTVFVIAHRLSTVRNSNAIMVLEHGEIIERGDHDDLIAQRGKYYQLYMGMFELN